MAVDLLFADSPGSLDLVFGGQGAAPQPRALGMAATLPPPVMAGVLRAGALPLAASAALPAIAGPAEITYDNAVSRGPVRWCRAPWQGTSALPMACRAPHHATASEETAVDCRCGSATLFGARLATRWQPMAAHLRPLPRIPWGQGSARSRLLAGGFSHLSMAVRPASRFGYAEASPAPIWVRSGWRDLFRWARPTLVIPWGAGAPLASMTAVPFDVGRGVRPAWRIPWGEGKTPDHGRCAGPVVPPNPGGYTPSTHLLFDQSMPASLHLVFGGLHVVRPSAKVTIPILRAYLVVNEVILLRVANNLPLPALALSLSIDVDSWVWGWQASLPASQLGNLLPAGPGAPVELEATVNGVTFRLLAEKITRERSFATGRITVSGRGIAAELGDPYALSVSRSNLSDQTAQQIANDALTINNVGIGWAIDWGITDWLVPAGVWSHTGDHIGAVLRIAEAAGAYVQADRAGRTLMVRHRYPMPPWDWHLAPPDFSLPSAVTSRESIEWIERPGYNAVYVSGEGSGVLAQCVRAGTAGDLVAPMITDQLNTAVEVATQRGLSILADTGRQLRMLLDTPVLPGVGIYPVGSMVEFTENGTSRIGIVRALSIQAAFPRVRQTIEVECRE
jgi:hypothetical protein